MLLLVITHISDPTVKRLPLSWLWPAEYTRSQTRPHGTLVPCTFFETLFWGLNWGRDLSESYGAGLILNRRHQLTAKTFPPDDWWWDQDGVHRVRDFSSPNLQGLKKNQSAPRSSEHPPVMGEKMSKRLGGIKGCKYKTSSWHLNRFPDANNIGSTV